jgi:hypothetical protein
VLFNSFAKKERNARGASDLNPIETTTPQGAVPKEFGKYLWNTGPTPTYKFSDQWVASDRLLLDVAYTHVGNNFVLGFHSPELRDVQPSFVISTGMNGRSANESVFIRPVNEVSVNANYFIPGKFGGDHALKFGGYWKDARSTSISHRGGFATVRFRTDESNNCSLLATGCEVDLVRDGYTLYDLKNNAAFIQDTFTRGRVTASLGLRYDQNHDEALPGTIGANPLGMGQGTTQWLPGIAFPGADPGVTFNDFSPRLGFTYDMTGNGKTLAKANFSRYYGQVGIGGIASTINPVSQTTLRYPWVDLNNDKKAQANEVLASANPLATGGNWSAANPANVTSSNSVDPDIRNDFTDELIIGLDREIGNGFAAGANYVWRRYGDFQWNDRQGITTADWLPTTFTPTTASCPGNDGNRISAANCPTITYYQPAFQQPTILRLSMAEGFQRTFNGVELSARKRLANRWLMNTSFSYNSTIVDFGEFTGSQPSTASAALSEDPTNRNQRDGFQYDYLTAGSGIGNVYVNAKWLFKISGLYQLPGEVNVSAFYNARQGYPLEYTVQTPSRINGAGQVDVLLDPVGESRLPNYQNLDFHIERPVRIGSTRFIPAMDIFNVMNSNTIQAIRSRQNAANANQVQAILAPRVARIGVRVNW